MPLPHGLNSPHPGQPRPLDADLTVPRPDPLCAVPTSTPAHCAAAPHTSPRHTPIDHTDLTDSLRGPGATVADHCRCEHATVQCVAITCMWAIYYWQPFFLIKSVTTMTDFILVSYLKICPRMLEIVSHRTATEFRWQLPTKLPSKFGDNLLPNLVTEYFLWLIATEQPPNELIAEPSITENFGDCFRWLLPICHLNGAFYHQKFRWQKTIFPPMLLTSIVVFLPLLGTPFFLPLSKFPHTHAYRC